MVDSISVFPPGFQYDDGSGNPVSGAYMQFFDAGTSTPKTVYADKDLTTAIGTSVTCNSAGQPTSDGGTTPCSVYVGTAAYKIVIKTSSSGSTLLTLDNQKGAVDTSAFGGSSSSATSFPVVTKSLDYTAVSGDQNTLFKFNPSAANRTLTMPNAATVGNGWGVWVQHIGTANNVLIVPAASSGQTFSEGLKNYGSQYCLIAQGEEVFLVSDGAGWVIADHKNRAPKWGYLTIAVEDRLSTPPGSPVVGGIYIVTAAPTGAWSTFAQHDLALYSGGSWVNITPPTDSGIQAWVKDEDQYYQFRATAWVNEIGVAANPGTFFLTTQALQEAAANNQVAVTSGLQHFHPTAAKWWVDLAVSGGVPAVSASYNNTSITDTATGDVAITIATDFSSANWCAVPGHVSDAAGITPRVIGVKTGTLAAGTVSLVCTGTGAVANDPNNWTCTGHGDL